MGQGADRGEAFDPGEVFATGGGEHSAVADEDDFFQVVSIAQFVDFGGDGGGVVGVSFENFAAHGAALGVAEESDDDLFVAFLFVTVVAEVGKFAVLVSALEVGAGDVVEDEGSVL